MEDFSTLLRRLMDASDVSASELGRRLKHSNNAFVSQVLLRERNIPPDAIEDWASALRLDGASRSEFIVAAHMSHSTPFIRELYRRIRADLRERDAAIADLKKNHDRLFDLLEQRDRENAELTRRLEECLRTRPPSSPAA